MRDASEGQQKHGQQEHSVMLPLFSTTDKNGRMTTLQPGHRIGRGGSIAAVVARIRCTMGTNRLRAVRRSARPGTDTGDQHFPRSSGHCDRRRGAALHLDQCDQQFVFKCDSAVWTDQDSWSVRDARSHRRTHRNRGSPPALDASQQSVEPLQSRGNSNVADDPQRARRRRRSCLRPLDRHHTPAVARLYLPRPAASGGHRATPHGGFVVHRNADRREFY